MVCCISWSEISYFRLLWVCSLLAAFARNACRSSCLKCIIVTQTSVIPVATRQIVYVCVQSLSHVRLFATPWTAARQASLSFTISQSLLKLMSIKSVMPSNHSSSVTPFSSCLQSFPASGSFPMNRLFASDGRNIGTSASASVFPKSHCLFITIHYLGGSKEIM